MQITENQRLKIIRKALHLKQEEFGASLGLTQGGYSDIERGKNNVSGKIKLFLRQVHNINLHWLETGQGEMFSVNINDSEDNEGSEVSNAENDLVENLKNEIQKLKNENLQLKTENNLYIDLCSAKDKTIEALESQIKSLKSIKK